MVRGAEVTGICTAAVAPHFADCEIGDATLPGCHLHAASLEGDIILSEAGAYFLDQCYSAMAGTSTPSIDFGSGVGSTQLNMRHYSGGIEIKNIGQNGTDNMSLEGDGQLILNTNCSGGTIAIRGSFKVTDNASAAVTLVYDDNTTNITFTKNIEEADVTTDKTTTPWNKVKKIKNTSTELTRKALKDVNAADVTSINTVIGQEVEP